MMYQKAKVFHQLPSEGWGILNPWTAWQFDNAVFSVGFIAEKRREEVDKTGRYKWTLEEALGIKEKEFASLEALAMAFGSMAKVIQ